MVLVFCECGCGELMEDIRYRRKRKYINHHYSRCQTEEHRRRNSESLKGRTFSEDHKQKISEYHADVSRNNNGRWVGGISFLPYCFKFNLRLKESIRKRDNYICQLCGKNQETGKRKLSVHHIHYDKENCNPDLITLCHSCNTKVNNNRNYWEEFFMIKLRERNIYE